MCNLFENLVDLATALIINVNVDQQPDPRREALDSEFEERFRDVTKNFRQNTLEAVEQLDRVIDEKINQMYDLLRKASWAPTCGYRFDLGRKSNAEATSYRNLGDSALQRGHDEPCDTEAQAAYTSSLAFAVPASEEEATAYARRSELWYRTRKYESCLLDANRALKSDRCPPHLKTHLEARRKACVQKIEEENGRKIDLINQFMSDDSFAKLFPAVYSGFFIPDHPQENRTEPRHVDLLHPIPTRSLATSYEPGMGRILVAERDIEAGEIMSQDKFFSMVLKPEKALNNCAYCLVKCDAPISCPTCVYELYCGEDCREKAFRSHHEFECKLWPYYLYEPAEMDKVDEFILVVRTFLIGTKQGVDLRKLMEDAKFRDLFPAQISYNADVVDGGYATICHEEAKVELLTAMDILRSVKLIHVLRKLGFFGDDDVNEGDEYAENLTETEIFATKLLIKHFTSRKSNSFVVTERLSRTPFALKQKCERIGEGTLGLHSLINHSCDPNAADFTRRRDNFLYALRPIKAGEQIFISYGYCYFDGTSSNRLRQHSMYYGFRCSCPACVGNWPVVTCLSGSPTQFSTENSDIIAEIENKSRVIWSPATVKSRQNVILRPWKIVCDFCRDLHTHVSQPSLLIVKSENFIEGCMRHLSNFYVDSLEEVEPDKTNILRSLEKAPSSIEGHNDATIATDK